MVAPPIAVPTGARLFVVQGAPPPFAVRTGARPLVDPMVALLTALLTPIIEGAPTITAVLITAARPSSRREWGQALRPV
jgi:hypothetical protein